MVKVKGKQVVIEIGGVVFKTEEYAHPDTMAERISVALGLEPSDGVPSDPEAAYKLSKAVRTGQVMTCPTCGTKSVKKLATQAFCCGKCKDMYWNERRKLS